MKIDEVLDKSDDQLWTAAQVARYLQLSVSWVYKASEAGLLPTRRIGAAVRFLPDDIRRYVRGEWKPTSAADLKATGTNRR